MAEKISVEYVKLSEIKPYGNNPRDNKEAITYVANSIKAFGFKNPIIIDDKNTIVCGHTRYEAAKHLRIDPVPCIRASDLTPDQIDAFRLADNKVTEFSKWNTDQLTLELAALDGIIDMGEFGFGNIEEVVEEKPTPEMDELPLQQFEHHDYLVFVFPNENLWAEAVTRFNIKDVEAHVGKTKKTGTGRVLDGKILLEMLKNKK